MSELLNFLIYNPFSWLLLQLNNLTGSYGLAIILFALLTKVILLYFTAKGKKGMMRTQLIQPKMQELQKKYQNDKQKLNEAMMQLYQTEGISPTGGCLWMLLPFPILIMLYTVIREPLTRLMGFTMTSAEAVERITAFFTQNGIPVTEVSAQQNFYQELHLAQRVHENFSAVQAYFSDLQLNDINFSFLGMDMTAIPPLPWVQLSATLLIPLISAVTAYLAFWLSTKMNPPQGAAASQSKMMGLFSPAISLWIGFSMPSAMGVYWIANNVFTMAQDYFLTKYYRKIIDEEARQRAELEERRRKAEQAQKEEERLRRQERLEEHKKKGRKTYVMKKTPPKHPKKKS